MSSYFDDSEDEDDNANLKPSISETEIENAKEKISVHKAAADDYFRVKEYESALSSYTVIMNIFN